MKSEHAHGEEEAGRGGDDYCSKGGQARNHHLFYLYDASPLPLDVSKEVKDMLISQRGRRRCQRCRIKRRAGCPQRIIDSDSASPADDVIRADMLRQAREIKATSDALSRTLCRTDTKGSSHVDLVGHAQRRQHGKLRISFPLILRQSCRPAQRPAGR